MEHSTGAFILSHTKSSKGGGGVTPIGTVSTATTGVKMESNGLAFLRLVVKRSSSLAGPHQINSQEDEMLLDRLAVVDAQRTEAKMGVAKDWVKGVKSANWQWSSSQRAFSTVKNLDPGRSCGHSAYGSNPP